MVNKKEIKCHEDYLQCGYEHKCKNKECMKCTRRLRCNLSLTLAEQIAIEDFAMCDLQIMIDEKSKQVELLQNIMRKVMHKVFANDKSDENLKAKKMMKKIKKEIKHNKNKKSLWRYARGE